MSYGTVGRSSGLRFLPPTIIQVIIMIWVPVSTTLPPVDGWPTTRQCRTAVLQYWFRNDSAVPYHFPFFLFSPTIPVCPLRRADWTCLVFYTALYGLVSSCYWLTDNSLLGFNLKIGTGWHWHYIFVATTTTTFGCHTVSIINWRPSRKLTVQYCNVSPSPSCLIPPGRGRGEDE